MKSILVIDDNRDIRENTAEILELAGYKTFTAENGKLGVDLAIRENAWGLARYARSVQESGFVPIIEPEILMDGDHSIEYCAKVTTHVLSNVYHELLRHKVDIDCTLLKPNMVIFLILSRKRR